ncbi:MAG: mannonate dehydratase [Pseudomonadota bacterium]|jgi:mannonate dehydratase
MQETWRWFGPEDPVTLRQVKQTGATGIVSALDNIPTGEAWPLADILERKRIIEEAGLVWSVVESVPVHNAIKSRTGDFERMIENYKISLRNLGQAGLETVCYNFMPVVDWTRTSLSFEAGDNSVALKFEMTDFAAYDIFVLQREGARDSYNPSVIAKAEQLYATMTAEQITALESNIIAGLPGGEGSYNASTIKQAIELFASFSNDQYRQHLFMFLDEVIPVAEAAGIKMAIHPDDPPFSLFGLPRVVSTAEDARLIVNHFNSVANGITMCAGSFGSRGDNDLVAMINEFHNRVYFVHLRNIKREEDGSFFESDHLDGDNDMIGIVNALLSEESRREADEHGVMGQIPMRPDHGHTMDIDVIAKTTRPGYAYAGRMRGLAELRGVIHTVSNMRRLMK